MPRYAVARPAAHTSRQYLGEHDGKWYDLDAMPTRPLGLLILAHGGGTITGTATGRYEYRPDGARAEVYEVHDPQALPWV